MSTAPAGGAPAPSARRPRLDVGSRGNTAMSRKVLEKIAAQVAKDETQAGGYLAAKPASGRALL